MIRHALTEGLLLLRDRAIVSSVLALALAVPITLAGVGAAVMNWLAPVAEFILSSLSKRMSETLAEEIERDPGVGMQLAHHPQRRLVSELGIGDRDHADRLTRPVLDQERDQRHDHTHDQRLAVQQQAELERLGTLGYLAGGAAAPQWSGVTAAREAMPRDGEPRYSFMGTYSSSSGLASAWRWKRG
mgnify:CR=1 FL=1